MHIEKSGVFKMCVVYPILRNYFKFFRLDNVPTDILFQVFKNSGVPIGVKIQGTFEIVNDIKCFEVAFPSNNSSFYYSIPPMLNLIHKIDEIM